MEQRLQPPSMGPTKCHMDLITSCMAVTMAIMASLSMVSSNMGSISVDLESIMDLESITGSRDGNDSFLEADYEFDMNVKSNYEYVCMR